MHSLNRKIYVLRRETGRHFGDGGYSCLSFALDFGGVSGGVAWGAPKDLSDFGVPYGRIFDGLKSESDMTGSCMHVLPSETLSPSLSGTPARLVPCIPLGPSTSMGPIPMGPDLLKHCIARKQSATAIATHMLANRLGFCLLVFRGCVLVGVKLPRFLRQRHWTSSSTTLIN